MSLLRYGYLIVSKFIVKKVPSLMPNIFNYDLSYILALKRVNLMPLFCYYLFKAFFFSHFYRSCVFQGPYFCYFMIICIILLLIVSKFIKRTVFY